MKMINSGNGFGGIINYCQNLLLTGFFITCSPVSYILWHYLLVTCAGDV